MRTLILRSLAVALALLSAGCSRDAFAQTVTQQPQFVAPRTVLDVGNGPTEFRMITGSMAVFTSQGSGTGSTSGASSALTLTAVPASPPCVGCVASASGITLGTTVVSYNGVTSLTLSSSPNLPAGTAISWGSACPSTAPTQPVALVQAAVGADLPFYTAARVCAYGATGPGGQFTSFPVGAH